MARFLNAIRIAGLAFILNIASACHVGEAGDAQVPLAETLDRSGTAAKSADGKLAVVVTLRNRSPNRVEFMVLEHCPVFIRVYRAGPGEGVPLYTEDLRPCVRSGRAITLPPNGTVELSRLVGIDELRAGGVSNGNYHVVAVVTAGTPFTIDLGNVDI
jgi:hypothetical protein